MSSSSIQPQTSYSTDNDMGIAGAQHVSYKGKHLYQSQSAFERFSTFAIRILAGTILFSLVILSWSTTAVMDADEHTYFLADGIIFHLVVLVMIVVVAVVWKNHHASIMSSLKRFSFFRSFKKLIQKVSTSPYCSPYFVLIVLLVLSAFYVVAVAPVPISDSANVSNIATQILYGDFSAFNTESYMDFYSFQKGIVLLFALIYSVVGTGNYLAIELLNVVWLGVSFFCMISIVPKNFRWWILIAIICFQPIWFYTIFVYGTLPGLAFSMLAVRFLLCFHQTGKFRYLPICVLSIFVASVCKSNYSVFAIAIGLFLLGETIVYRRVAAVALIALILLFGFKTNIVNQGIYSVSGTYDERVAMTKGMPPLAYIGMGLNDDSPRAEGWFTGYTERIYIDNKADIYAINKQAKKDLLERLDAFVRHPKYAMSFFVRKTISQWCEPTFQSLWLQEVRNPTAVDNSMYEFMTAYGHRSFRNAFIYVMNILQSLVYIGSFFYLVFYKKEKGIFPLIGMLIFIGGFAVHLFWEAKGQYTLPYFFLLLPYGIFGLHYLIDTMSACLEEIFNRLAVHHA